MVNYKYALTLASLLYGIKSQNEDDLIEIGLNANNLIGNKRVRLYKATLPVNQGIVDLPCNAVLVEAVTLNGEDFNISSNLKIGGDYNSLLTEEYIEARKQENHSLYLSGRYVHFNKIGNQIEVDPSIKRVNVLYYGEILDEDGLPELTDSEALAVATYIAYFTKYKDSIRQPTKENLQVTQMLKAEWLKNCNQARLPEYFDQNLLDEILDVKASWNHKHYARSFKPIM